MQPGLLQAHLQPEQLDEANSWYCPKCKKHQQVGLCQYGSLDEDLLASDFDVFTSADISIFTVSQNMVCCSGTCNVECHELSKCARQAFESGRRQWC